MRRNAPTLLNVAYRPRLFHDGRESRLEQQVWGPLLAANEMANPSVGAVLDRISALADYDGLFEAAFDGDGPGMETVGAALAAYQRTLLAADSPFDRREDDDGAFTPAAARGLELFNGKARCALCHPADGPAPQFTDEDAHNTGVGYRRAHARPLAERRTYRIAPGVAVEIDLGAVAESAEARPEDLGVYEVTGRPADVWKYRTPSLRNVALTAPYMHDGSMATLDDVVAFYNRGGFAHEGLDPALRPLGLSQAEAADLVAFLTALTGDVSRLTEDAASAPIGDRTGGGGAGNAGVALFD